MLLFPPFGCHEQNETWDPHSGSTALQLHCIYEARHVVEWNYRVIYGCHYPEACQLNLSHRSPGRISSMQYSELKLVLTKLTFVGAARCSHIPALFTYVWACGSYLSCVMSKAIIFLPHHHVGVVLRLANRWHCNSLFSLCEELSVVLNVNRTDLPLQREEERREDRMDGIEGRYTRRKGWEEKKKRRAGFKRWDRKEGVDGKPVNLVEGEVNGKDERKTWREWEARRKRSDRVLQNKRVITMQRKWRRKMHKWRQE